MTHQPVSDTPPADPRRAGVPVSEELRARVNTHVQASGVETPVELCYQTFGRPDADPLLLVMGLGGPMTWWDPDLCTRLARAGFFVIRYDNRDTGRSTRIPARVGRPQIVRAFSTGRGPAPYSLGDMADDAIGLLDHLGIEAAHVAGVSMGGMIAQTMAIEHPDRVLSLASVMSTTGGRTVGWQSPRLFPALLAPAGTTLDAYVKSSALVWRLIGSPGYPGSPEERRARAEETWERGFSASGVLRQILAVLTQTNRRARLAEVKVPTVVIHGLADRMVHVSGGRATAAAIADAELLLLEGMGHDLPAGLFDTFTEAIRRNADRARD
ncbi:alpha/beta hydrolase [Nocardioides gansuensis]|uniref:Alpha/beta hydrolase n=1 Tax=Nocardioides gansuensis TaxID=2138300 RepID=A0A2T8F7F0_9ACTN|nr:alpha/beta hydrolase [Nocardioides gansuensis]PVG81630.1 alpha/beta hydrolase [Nocardioides gansuensis]